MAPELTVYEKPTCTTCRNLTALLDERGIDFARVDYHVDPIGEERIRELAEMAGVGPAGLLRAKAPVYRELGLADGGRSDDELFALLAEHPELLQRPIVVRGERAVLARPVERVEELFD